MLLVSMLKVPMIEVDIAKVLQAADSELLFLFVSTQIPRDVQAKVVEMDFTDPVVFAKLEDKAEGARKIFREELDLDDTRKGPFNALVARLMSVWEAAGKRGEKRQAEDAERKIGDMPRALPKARHLELLRAYEASHRELPDYLVPAPAYIEARLEQMEDGEIIAEQLTAVLTREDMKDNSWGAARVMADGTLKLQKTGHGEAKPPKSSEELRSRIKVMGIAWEFIRLKYPTRRTSRL